MYSLALFDDSISCLQSVLDKVHCQIGGDEHGLVGQVASTSLPGVGLAELLAGQSEGIFGGGQDKDKDKEEPLQSGMGCAYGCWEGHVECR